VEKDDGCDFLGATFFFTAGDYCFLCEELKSLGRFLSGKMLNLFPSSSVSSSLPALGWPAN
jgi:hypothetical protein